MMGRTHKIVTAVSLYCSTLDPVLTIVGASAASLPDQAEKYLPFCRHRGMTHWILFWLGLTLLLFYPSYFGYDWISPEHTSWKIAAGIALGGLCHVLQDALSLRGVPVVSGVHIKLRLYSTGTRSEYIVAFLICCSFIGYYFYTNPAEWNALVATLTHYYHYVQSHIVANKLN